MNASGYSYRAAAADGRIVSGRVDVSSRAEAGALLESRGLLAIELREATGLGARRRQLPAGDLALGLRLLAGLLAAGLPMTRALHAFEALAPASWQPVIEHLREAVRAGKGLAASLDGAPIEFPPVVIGVVRAGEAGQGLAEAVTRAAELMESTATAQASLRSALAYPIVLACAGVGSIAMLVGVVLPRFAAILADLRQQLPPATRLVMSASVAAQHAAIPLLIAGAVGAVAWRGWVATQAGRAAWHRFLLAAPVLGSLRLAFATARACHSLSALLGTGVPASEAVRHASLAAGDAEVGARLLAARGELAAGTPLARAMATHGAMTVVAIRLAHAGEETGRLGEMLAHAAELEQARAARALSTFVRLLEPVLILGFAVVVAFVAAALLQAVYSVRPTP